MADRFYGTPDLISLAAGKGWDYRLRLKSSLQVFVDGWKAALARHVSDRLPYLTGVELTHRRVTTNIGIINDHRLRRSVCEAAGRSAAGGVTTNRG